MSSCPSARQADTVHASDLVASGISHFSSRWWTRIPRSTLPLWEMTSGACCVQWVWHGYSGYMYLRPTTEAFGVCTCGLDFFSTCPLYPAVTCPVLGVTEEHKKFVFFWEGRRRYDSLIRYAWFDSGYILRQSTEDFWTVFVTCST